MSIYNTITQALKNKLRAKNIYNGNIHVIIESLRYLRYTFFMVVKFC